MIDPNASLFRALAAGGACAVAGAEPCVAQGGVYPEVRFIAAPSLPPSFPARPFHLASNWQGNMIPGFQQGAVFDGAGVTVPWWVVSFSQQEFTTQLKVRGCTTQFRLDGNSYDVTNTYGEGLTIGASNVTAQSTLDLLAAAAPSSLSSGLLTRIGGAGACTVNVHNNNSLGVGGLEFARGAINIKSGASLSGGVDVELFGQHIVLHMLIGASSGSPAANLTCDPGGKVTASTNLSVSGSGAFFANGVGQVNRVLSIGSNGVVSVSGPLSIATGANTVTGLRARSEISLSDAGSLSASSYSQTAGTLSVLAFAGSAQPVLSISGAAALGASFRVVSFAPAFNPAVGQRFPLMTPASRTGQFAVAAFPGFGDDRFLRLDYVSSPSHRVEIVVDSSTTDIGYGAPQSVGIAGEPRAAALGDLTGDVFPELVLSVPGDTPATPGSLVFLTNAGNNALGEWQGFAASTQIAIGRDPRTVLVADIDNDGDRDALVAEAGEDAVRLLRNLGGAPGSIPSFVQSLFTMGDGPVDLEVADLTGDGLPDIITADGSSNPPTITVRVNAGSGGFGDAAAHVVGEMGSGPSGVGAGDLDNDKDVDIVAASPANGGSVVVLPNTSLADGLTFGQRQTFLTRAQPRAIAVRDFNRDNKPDILTAEGDTQQQGFLTILVNTSAGAIAFASAAPLPLAENVLAVVPNDSDADGDADIAALTITPNGREVAVFRNDTLGAGGPVTLTQRETIGAGENPSVVAAADIDNDGRDDIVTCDPGGADGANGADVTSRLNDFPGPAPGDVNADGVVDFLDLNLLLGAYGVSIGHPAYLPASDFNHDGVTNFIDLNTLLSVYGA